MEILREDSSYAADCLKRVLQKNMGGGWEKMVGVGYAYKKLIIKIINNISKREKTSEITLFD